jgi:hypothetical protein
MSAPGRPDSDLVGRRSSVWVAKTSTATKNETVLGREGLNTILASTQREGFTGTRLGVQHTYILLRMG